MKLKKFGALLLTGVLAITSLTTSAFAAKREKRSAERAAGVQRRSRWQDVSWCQTANIL